MSTSSRFFSLTFTQQANSITINQHNKRNNPSAAMTDSCAGKPSLHGPRQRNAQTHLTRNDNSHAAAVYPTIAPVPVGKASLFLSSMAIALAPNVWKQEKALIRRSLSGGQSTLETIRHHSICHLSIHFTNNFNIISVYHNNHKLEESHWEDAIEYDRPNFTAIFDVTKQVSDLKEYSEENRSLHKAY